MNTNTAINTSTAPDTLDEVFCEMQALGLHVRPITETMPARVREEQAAFTLKMLKRYSVARKTGQEAFVTMTAAKVALQATASSTLNQMVVFGAREQVEDLLGVEIGNDWRANLAAIEAATARLEKPWIAVTELHLLMLGQRDHLHARDVFAKELAAA